MPESQTYARPSAIAPRRRRSISPGFIWGAVAGATIGLGIILNTGLLYSSASALMAGMVFISTALGGLFGRIMSHLLADDVALLAHAGMGGQQTPANPASMADISDYRLLKREAKDKNISVQEVREIMASVRMADRTPSGAYKTESFEFTVPSQTSSSPLL